MKGKVTLIAVLTCMVLLVSTSAMAAVPYSDWLLQRGFGNYGEGVVTWNNATGVKVATALTTGTNTFAINTDEEVIIIGDGGAVAGTQAAITFTIINANSGSAITGTITKDSNDALTLEINAAGSAAQSKTDDWTADTLTEAVTSANALTWTEVDFTVTVAAGSSLPDSSYTDYYEPPAMEDIGATAFTVGAGGTKTLTLKMVDKTLFDTANLDFTTSSIDDFKTTIEAMYGGAQNTVTIADGINSDLANGMADVANLGAGDWETTGLDMPFTAGGAAVDYLEEDRYKSISYISAYANAATTTNIKIFDGSTQIWESAPMSDDTWTNYDFDLPITSTGNQYLTVQMYSSGTIATVTQMYVIGRTD